MACLGLLHCSLVDYIYGSSLVSRYSILGDFDIFINGNEYLGTSVIFSNRSISYLF